MSRATQTIVIFLVAVSTFAGSDRQLVVTDESAEFRIDGLKFNIAGKLPIVLEEFLE